MTKPLLVFALEQESQGLFSDYDLLFTGLGKVNAAYKLTKALHQKKPSIVVNLGTAGSSVHKACSVVHCTRFVQRDMDVSPLGFEKFVTPFEEGDVFLDCGIAVAGLPHATCGTGDSFDVSHSAGHYDIVDMEAYALAKICRDEVIPFLCLKYISDGADGEAAKDWQESLLHAAQALKENFLLSLKQQ